MKYKNYNNLIFFWRSTEDIFGKIINYFNRITFGEGWYPTHTGIVIEESDTDVLIAEAGPKGFIIEGNWYSKEWLDSRIEAGYVKFGKVKSKLTNVYENARKYEGIKYGFINIFFHGLNLLLRMLGRRQIKYSDGIKYMHCSEGVSRVIYDSSIINIAEEYGIEDYEAVSPAHIFKSKFIEILE